MTPIASLLEANEYLSANQSWVEATATARTRALVVATAYLNGQYEWVGEVVSTSQENSWPRTGTDKWGNDIGDTTPQVIKDACCELALVEIGDASILPERDGSQSQRITTGESLTVGPISTSEQYAVDRESVRPGHYKSELVDAMLTRYIKRRAGGYGSIPHVLP